MNTPWWRPQSVITGMCGLTWQIVAAVAFYPTRIGDLGGMQRGLVAAQTPTLLIQGDRDALSSPAVATALGCTRVTVPIDAHVRMASVVFDECGHAFAHRGHAGDDTASAAKTALSLAAHWILRFL